MNEIKIKNIQIKNLYGYAKADFTFDDKMNVIKAPTAGGKSTILNSILFALGFGKSNYLPTIEGYKIPNMESSVDVLLNANGMDYTLKVNSVQKWKVVDKESEKRELIGNELEYFYDGINCKLTNYKEKIASLFGVPYDKIEMFVDIKYFNADTTKWKWTNRRELIFGLLGINEKTAKLAEDEQFSLISTDIKKGKDEVEIQKMLNTEKKGIEEEQKRIMSVLDSKDKDLVNLLGIDFVALKQQKADIKLEIDKLNESSSESSYMQEKQRLFNEYNKLKMDLREIETKNSDIKYEYNNKVRKCEDSISSTERELKIYNDKIKRLESDIEDCEIEISIENDKLFDNKQTICPLCKRELQKDKIDELVIEFEKSRVVAISTIATKRTELGLELERVNGLIKCLSDKLTMLKNDYTAILDNGYELLNDNSLPKQIEDKQAEIDNLKVSDTENEVTNKKLELSQRYEDIISQVARENEIDRVKKDIADLKLRLNELAKNDSIRIQKANQLKEYTKAKANLAVDTVNANFEGIEFKLFNINGALAENTIETACIVMLDGVEYDKQSNGQKIYSDICVAKALRKLYNLNMFMFIDEKQSMTLPYEVDCQVVELQTYDEVVNMENKYKDALKNGDEKLIAECLLNLEKAKIEFKESQIGKAIKISDIYTINDTIKGE